jgi:hypothetical protein
MGCNMNSSLKEMRSGFGFLEEIVDEPGTNRSEKTSISSKGAVSEAALLRHLAPLREARVWLPGESSAHATDLRIHRVMASGGQGAVVEFRAGN